ncbi:kinase phosphorylation protein-domain-containing protein [Pholiota molesta]|nr:kinase phosphorylation protein-domain-containing protein [Pholiota molesta]
MFEPIRGGTRGGQAEFKWSDVSADKDREYQCTTGRWQKNKDIHWYNRDLDDKGAAAKAEEIRKIKELEAEALPLHCYEPAKPGSKSTTSGANAVPVASTSASKYASPDGAAAVDPEKNAANRRRRSAAHARRALKEISRSGAHEVRDLEERSIRSRGRESNRDEDEDEDRHRRRDRDVYRGRSSRSRRSRSRTPVRPGGRDEVAIPPLHGEEDDRRMHPDRVSERRRRVDAAYDQQERESERERDRMPLNQPISLHASP